MKKFWLSILALIGATFLSVAALSACKKQDANSIPVAGIIFNTLSVEGTKVYGKVSNNTTEFSFIDEVTVKGNATYILDDDKDCGSPIISKTVDLEIGDNTFYILEIINKEIKLFTVTIRRRPMYDVTFNTNNAMTVKKQVVEEDNLVVKPETLQLGYVVTGWDYDFSNPIVQDITITGFCEVADEMKPFNFSSTSTTCDITGVTDYNATKIIIPECVTSIASGAFSYCTNLQSVEIPDSVISIASDAFSRCYNLSYNIKNGLKYLGNTSNPFLYLVGVDSAKIITAAIDNKCKIIGNSAFYNCDSLTSVEIGDSVMSIGNYAFYDCDSLTSLEIGTSVTSIGNSAFYSCNSLTNITFKDMSTWYRTTDLSGWKNKTGGINTSVVGWVTNATNFTNTYSAYYWYKL